MSDISHMFLNKLYDMSEGELRSINRYEVGEQLDLPNGETDGIVVRLYARRMITKTVGTNILLTQEAKNMLDNERQKANTS
jgi:hypothetical protein